MSIIVGLCTNAKRVSLDRPDAKSFPFVVMDISTSVGAETLGEMHKREFWSRYVAFTKVSPNLQESDPVFSTFVAVILTAVPPLTPPICGEIESIAMGAKNRKGTAAPKSIPFVETATVASPMGYEGARQRMREEDTKRAGTTVPSPTPKPSNLQPSSGVSWNPLPVRMTLVLVVPMGG